MDIDEQVAFIPLFHQSKNQSTKLQEQHYRQFLILLSRHQTIQIKQ